MILRKSTKKILYVSEVSENIRKVAVSTSDLYSSLFDHHGQFSCMKVKDKLPTSMHSSCIAYYVPL